MHRLFVFFAAVLLVACSPLSESEPPPTTLIPTETPTPVPEPTATPSFVFGADAFSQGLIAKRNGDYARAIAAFQAVLAGNPGPEQAQEAQFRLGEAYWLNGDNNRAVAALSLYLQAYPAGSHGSETHYFLADAYRRLKDYGNAFTHLTAYRATSQMLVGDTDAILADLLVLMGDSTGALTQYDRALQDRTLTAAQRISFLMRAADVHSGRGEPASAAARYDAALALTADPRTRADLDWRAGEAYAAAKDLDNAVARWTEAFVKYPEQPGAYKSLVDLLNNNLRVDDFQRGLVDYHAAAWDASIAAFKNHLKSDSPLEGDAHYYIASAYTRKGAYTQAISEYDLIIKELPKAKQAPDAYLGKAAAYGSLGKLDDAVDVYRKFVAAYPEHTLADDALWRAALLLDRADRNTDARKLYEELQTKYPSRERAADALFWAGFIYYLDKDYKTAAARWETIAKNYTASAFYPRALFWLGKVSQARGLNDAAKNYWTQASALENGYYSWRAGSVLTQQKPPAPSYDLARYATETPADRAELEKWLGGWAKGNGALGTLDAATLADPNFKRGSELLRVDRTVEARKEFAALVANRQNDPRALYGLALYLRDNNLFSLSLDCGERIARLARSAGAPAAPRMLWMLRYPTHYADLIVAESKANEVDPLLYFALVRQESSFNPWVTSSADARGLGQIMPKTAQGIAQSLKVSNYKLDQLYLPFVNIRFGVWYFAQDLRKFNEPIYALIAYNAGASRAQRWQRLDIDLAVEEIELTETNAYVRLVYSNWQQYQETYTPR